MNGRIGASTFFAHKQLAAYRILNVSHGVHEKIPPTYRNIMQQLTEK